MRRREMVLSAGAAVLGLSTFPLGWVPAADDRKKKILYFTRSAGFEHPVVHREGNKLSFSEKIMVEEGAKRGVEVVATKDGRVFDGDLDQFDAFAFYTSDVLTKPIQGRDEPPMSERGKKRFLDAVAGGKGFVAFHPTTDSFHSVGGKISDFLAMLGGEFVTHGQPQKAKMRITSPGFPGVEGLGDSFEMHEEWYAQNNFAKDLHVILVQETAGMKDACYQRPPFPATWARRHGKGRVFYTSLGHFEEVWTSPIFAQIVLGGFSWVLGQVDVDVTPNIDKVTPKANQMQN